MQRLKLNGMAILTFVLALAFVATAGAAEVRIASEISAGSHNAYVFEAGAPASGSVDFVSPSGDVFARELDSNGAAEFYFDSVTSIQSALGTCVTATFLLKRK